MANLRLFLGPGDHLIQPIKLKNGHGQYEQQKVPFGFWYQDLPFKLVRKATYMELYIMSNYRICKPQSEGDWDLTDSIGPDIVTQED